MGGCIPALISLCLSLGLAQGFYLPGVAPQDYAKASHIAARGDGLTCNLGLPSTDRLCLALQGDKVVLKVNKLTSTRTQLPYEYYSMPYCRPEKIMPSAENLGEVLRGDRIENSPYEVRGRCITVRRCLYQHLSLALAMRDHEHYLELQRLPICMEGKR